jgi:redox-sensitive bicupin YhaK (pirin superfamily)
VFTLPSENYQDESDQTRWDVPVKLISGQIGEHIGAMNRDPAAYPTQPLYAHITISPGAELSFPIKQGHNAFVVVFRESVTIGDAVVPNRHMAILMNAQQATGVHLAAPAGNVADARVLLIAGRPLREPIAQYGPFVMNTRDQLIQALEDFQAGKMG